MKVQIPDWHGDDWEELTGPNVTDEPKWAAEKATELFICECAAYDRIGKEPITVHVDDGTTISTWRVETESTFICYATEQCTAIPKKS